jgi:hypothetical protein
MGTKVIPIATHKPTTSLLDSKEWTDLPTWGKGDKRKNKQRHNSRIKSTNIGSKSPYTVGYHPRIHKANLPWRQRHGTVHERHP